MIFNNAQKVATIFFSGLLLLIILLMTPYYKYKLWWNMGSWQNSEELDIGKDFHGNFFALDTRQIIFEKLFFEIGLVTFIYLLSLVILKSKKHL